MLLYNTFNIYCVCIFSNICIIDSTVYENEKYKIIICCQIKDTYLDNNI